MWLVVLVTLVLCYGSQFFPGCKAALAELGCEVVGFTAVWSTQALCSFMAKVGISRAARGLDYWFLVGSYVCCCAAVLSLLALSLNVVKLLYDVCFAVGSSMGGASHTQESVVLVPMVPGVTLPTQHVPYIALAAITALIYHELGHALAAAVCHLHLRSFGVALFSFIPAAFVQIEDHLRRINPYKQLRIYTAGAWHNLTLGLVAGAMLWALPVLLSPLWITCSSQRGQECVWVGGIQDSVIDGSVPLPRPLSHVGIVSLNNRSIANTQDWNRAVSDIAMRNGPQQFCISNEYLEEVSLSLKCCAEGYTGRQLCFREESGNRYCLPGKEVAVRYWGDRCCRARGHKGETCLDLQMEGRSTLFRLELTTHKVVAFVEDIFDINKIRVSDYLPTILPSDASGLYYDDLPAYMKVFPYSWVSAFPFHVTIFLVYLQMISYGLMVVNLIPLRGLDGEHILTCILHIVNERLCRPPAPTGWDDDQEHAFIEKSPSPVTVVVDSGYDLDVNREPRRLPGMYGDAGVVDHQLQQIQVHRVLMAYSTWVLGLNIVFSLLLSLA